MGAWKLCWLVFVCLSMIDSSQAGRKLQEQERRLRAYTGNGTQPRHAPPIESFLVSDGSWVDCVPIEGQIAAHHPSLKDHVIRMMPPKTSSKPRNCHPQLFAQEHGGCPDGSIPVLRTNGSERYLRKTRPPLTDDFWTHGGGYSLFASLNPAATPQITHEYAITGVPNATGAYSGAHSIFSVNSPTLGDDAKDFSLSQFWVIDGHYYDNTLSTIEVGWQKFPSQHANDQPDAPHLFIYWTNNAYNHSSGVGSCYDLSCPGFVQQSNTWVIGGAMPKYTTLAQNATAAYEVEIEVVYEPADRNWWLYLDGEAIGYWPSSIYINGLMQGSCNQVQWGGEVVFYKDSSVANHSTTAMGSGAFPVAGYPVAAYQRNISYADASGAWVNADPTVLDAERRFDNPLCYDIQVQQGSFTNWGSYFFYGGPGGANPACHY